MILKLGDRGTQVKDMQKLMFNYIPIVVDGVFGKHTEYCLKGLQSGLDIKIDGIFGNQSYNSIKSAKGKNKTNHFNYKEWYCNCGCGGLKYSLKTMFMLETIRHNLDTGAIYVTSGYRCYQHNINVKGAKNSYHRKGMAADVYCIDGKVKPRKMYDFARKVFPVGGFGIYDASSRQVKFVHIDSRTYDNVVWSG